MNDIDNTVSKLLDKIKIAQNPQYKIELADELINNINKTDSFLNNLNLINALTIKLQSQMMLKNFYDAIETADQLLDINNAPMNKFMVNKSKGICFEKLNMNTEALDCFKKCYKINPHLNICQDIGRLYEKLNQQTDAIEIYEKILKYDPNNEFVKYKVEDLKSNSNKCQDIKKCIHKGYVYLTFKELESAKEIFEYILTLQNDCLDAYNYLGIINE